MRDEGFDLATIRKFVGFATDSLGAAREEIDALNVYPVPDGDTGTHMLLTMNAARQALAAVPGSDDAALGEALAGFAHGALTCARVTYAVIPPQLRGAGGPRLTKQAPHDRPTHTA